MGTEERSEHRDRTVAETAKTALAEFEKEVRALLGDKAVDDLNSLAEERSAFKAELINAVESGTSGPAMAEFLNGRAWLWKYCFEDVERDPEFKAQIEHALKLCSPSVPKDWRRAVREANDAHVMKLRRRLGV